MSATRACWRAAAILFAVAINVPAIATESDAIAAAIVEQDFAGAQRLLEAALAATPDDADLRFSLARVLAWGGDYDSALSEYDRLADRFPRNVDYLLGRAQTNVWIGNDVGALVDLERARAFAPDYEAIWRLQQEVLQRTGGSDAWIALREAAAERFPEADWWRRRSWLAVNRRQISVGVRHENLSNSAPAWDQLSLGLNWGQDDRRRYVAAVSQQSRFAGTENDAMFGGEWQVRKNWFSGFSLSVSPDARFLPEQSIAIHGGRRFSRGWGLDLALQKRAYATADAEAWATSVDRYFGDYRAAFTLYLTRLQDQSSAPGKLVSIGWYPAGPWNLALSLATGKEAEAIGPAEILVTDIESVTLTMRRRVTNRFGVEWSLGTHEQGNFYRRRYAGLALTYGF